MDLDFLEGGDERLALLLCRTAEPCARAARPVLSTARLSGWAPLRTTPSTVWSRRGNAGARLRRFHAFRVARVWSRSHMRVLLVTPFLPYPLSHGGAVR